MEIFSGTVAKAGCKRADDDYTLHISPNGYGEEVLHICVRRQHGEYRLYINGLPSPLGAHGLRGFILDKAFPGGKPGFTVLVSDMMRAHDAEIEKRDIAASLPGSFIQDGTGGRL